VDSGIFPHHPSFQNLRIEPYEPLPRYRGKCEVDPDTKKSFCNEKIVGAQHFAKAATVSGAFNPSIDFASPLDGDGHGRLVLFICLSFHLLTIFTQSANVVFIVILQQLLREIMGFLYDYMDMSMEEQAEWLLVLGLITILSLKFFTTCGGLTLKN
jgi:hypothetical protein